MSSERLASFLLLDCLTDISKKEQPSYFTNGKNSATCEKTELTRVSSESLIADLGVSVRAGEGLQGAPVPPLDLKARSLRTRRFCDLPKVTQLDNNVPGFSLLTSGPRFSQHTRRKRMQRIKKWGEILC